MSAEQPVLPSLVSDPRYGHMSNKAKALAFAKRRVLAERHGGATGSTASPPKRAKPAAASQDRKKQGAGEPPSGVRFPPIEPRGKQPSKPARSTARGVAHQNPPAKVKPIKVHEPTATHLPLLSSPRLSNSDSVAVGVRVRAFLPHEPRQLAVRMKNRTVTASVPDKGVFPFSYDHCFWSNDIEDADVRHATQRDVYEGLGRPLVQNVLAGYNSSIIAYGPTGSGKTHTMFGQPSRAVPHESAHKEDGGDHVDAADLDPCEMSRSAIGHEAGLIPRVCDSIFARMRGDASIQETTGRPEDDGNPMAQEERPILGVTMSAMEVYLENAYDLLNKGNKLAVRANGRKGYDVTGLSSASVESYEGIAEMMETIESQRHVACTKLNANSSRAHTLVQLEVRMQGIHPVRVLLADLAGSERVKEAGSSGVTLDQAKAINLSLMSLGNCISAVVKNTNRHGDLIEFRASTLTKILKDYIGGNSRTAIVTTVAPGLSHIASTIQALRFADRAKSIRTHAVISTELAEAVEVQNQLVENPSLFTDFSSGPGSPAGGALSNQPSKLKFAPVARKNEGGRLYMYRFKAQFRANNAIQMNLKTKSMARQERSLRILLMQEERNAFNRIERLRDKDKRLIVATRRRTTIGARSRVVSTSPAIDGPRRVRKLTKVVSEAPSSPMQASPAWRRAPRGNPPRGHRPRLPSIGAPAPPGAIAHPPKGLSATPPPRRPSVFSLMSASEQQEVLATMLPVSTPPADTVASPIAPPAPAVEPEPVTENSVPQAEASGETPPVEPKPPSKPSTPETQTSSAVRERGSVRMHIRQLLNNEPIERMTIVKDEGTDRDILRLDMANDRKFALRQQQHREKLEQTVARFEEVRTLIVGAEESEWEIIAADHKSWSDSHIKPSRATVIEATVAARPTVANFTRASQRFVIDYGGILCDDLEDNATVEECIEALVMCSVVDEVLADGGFGRCFIKELAAIAPLPIPARRRSAIPDDAAFETELEALIADVTTASFPNATYTTLTTSLERIFGIMVKDEDDQEAPTSPRVRGSPLRRQLARFLSVSSEKSYLLPEELRGASGGFSLKTFILWATIEAEAAEKEDLFTLNKPRLADLLRTLLPLHGATLILSVTDALAGELLSDEYLPQPPSDAVEPFTLHFMNLLERMAAKAHFRHIRGGFPEYFRTRVEFAALRLPIGDDGAVVVSDDVDPAIVTLSGGFEPKMNKLFPSAVDAVLWSSGITSPEDQSFLSNDSMNFNSPTSLNIVTTNEDGGVVLPRRMSVKPPPGTDVLMFDDSDVDTAAFGFLSTFSPHSFSLGGLWWFSAEHRLLAAPLNAESEAFKRVHGASTVGEAAEALLSESSIRSTSLPAASPQEIEEAVHAKFIQNPEALDKLLETGERIIVYCSEDRSRGDGGSSADGTNALGIALMKVRAQLGPQRDAIIAAATADEPIRFTEDHDWFGFLASSFARPILLRGAAFPTALHAFQALKFEGRYDDMEAVRLAYSPSAAVKVGGDPSRVLREDWSDVKGDAMCEAVLAKFSQHADLRDQLLATGQRKILDCSQHSDHYWGGAQDDGKNVSGIILMEVREKLREEQAAAAAAAAVVVVADEGSSSNAAGAIVAGAAAATGVALAVGHLDEFGAASPLAMATPQVTPSTRALEMQPADDDSQLQAGLPPIPELDGSPRGGDLDSHPAAENNSAVEPEPLLAPPQAPDEEAQQKMPDADSTDAVETPVVAAVATTSSVEQPDGEGVDFAPRLLHHEQLTSDLIDEHHHECEAALMASTAAVRRDAALRTRLDRKLANHLALMETQQQLAVDAFEDEYNFAKDALILQAQTQHVATREIAFVEQQQHKLPDSSAWISVVNVLVAEHREAVSSFFTSSAFAVHQQQLAQAASDEPPMEDPYTQLMLDYQAHQAETSELLSLHLKKCKAAYADASLTVEFSPIGSTDNSAAEVVVLRYDTAASQLLLKEFIEAATQWYHDSVVAVESLSDNNDIEPSGDSMAIVESSLEAHRLLNAISEEHYAACKALYNESVQLLMDTVAAQSTRDPDGKGVDFAPRLLHHEQLTSDLIDEHHHGCEAVLMASTAAVRRDAALRTRLDRKLSNHLALMETQQQLAADAFEDEYNFAKDALILQVLAQASATNEQHELMSSISAKALETLSAVEAIHQQHSEILSAMAFASRHVVSDLHGTFADSCSERERLFDAEVRRVDSCALLDYDEASARQRVIDEEVRAATLISQEVASSAQRARLYLVEWHAGVALRQTATIKRWIPVDRIKDTIQQVQLTIADESLGRMKVQREFVYAAEKLSSTMFLDCNPSPNTVIGVAEGLHRLEIEAKENSQSAVMHASAVMAAISMKRAILRECSARIKRDNALMRKHMAIGGNYSSGLFPDVVQDPEFHQQGSMISIEGRGKLQTVGNALPSVLAISTEIASSGHAKYISVNTSKGSVLNGSTHITTPPTELLSPHRKHRVANFEEHLAIETESATLIQRNFRSFLGKKQLAARQQQRESLLHDEIQSEEANAARLLQSAFHIARAKRVVRSRQALIKELNEARVSAERLDGDVSEDQNEESSAARLLQSAFHIARAKRVLRSRQALIGEHNEVRVKREQENKGGEDPRQLSARTIQRTFRSAAARRHLQHRQEVLRAHIEKRTATELTDEETNSGDVVVVRIPTPPVVPKPSASHRPSLRIQQQVSEQ